MTTTVIALAALIVVLATIPQGVMGFGYSLLAVPLLLLLVTKTTSVAILITTGIGLNGFLLWHLRDQAAIDRKLLAWLLVSTVVGLPFGVLALKMVNVSTLRIVAGTCVVLFAGLFCLNKAAIARTNAAIVLTGWFTGVLQASIGLVGPPAALLLTGQERAKDEVRKTLAAFFLVVNLITFPLLYATGTLSENGVALGVLCIPGAFLGARLGSFISRRVSQAQFMRLALALVSVAGAAAVYAGTAG